MNKSGMSPLIATVLMIGFAVSLGAVIMNLGSRITPPAKNVTYKCADLSFGVHKFSDGNYDICYTNKSLAFTVEAYRGEIDGLKLIVFFSGPKPPIKKDNVLKERLKPGDPQKITIPYSPEKQGEIKEVQLYPIIGKDEFAHLCNTAPVSITSVSQC